MKQDIFELAKQIQAHAKTGLHFVNNEYEIDRYEQIMEASSNILSTLSDEHPKKVRVVMDTEKLYVTPKVDIRVVVFNENGEFLMVKEKVDGLWTLPGGFCDVGYAPSEVAVKETWEEAGIDVRPKRLLGVLDKSRHGHPKTYYYLYTIFMLCEKIGGEEKPGMETLDVAYHPLQNLPPLSQPRITPEQLEMMYQFYSNESAPPYFD
ncbi:MAG TPA: ADP-ribose pyrophosphatase [Eubacteriaceae bacterium]|nr:ADP-ribose pyrophosphatase [Eubacteriaceae bacterium]